MTARRPTFAPSSSGMRSTSSDPALLGAVLLAAALDYRVGACHLRFSPGSSVGGRSSLPARERRRPPRRPRRREPDSRASALVVDRSRGRRRPASPVPTSAPGSRSGPACAARRGAPAPSTVITSASTRATASPGLYMCGSSIESSTSSPTSNGSAWRSISSRPPDSATSNVSIGSASPPSNRNACRAPPRARADRCRARSSSRATRGLTRIRCASASGWRVDHVAQLAQRPRSRPSRPSAPRPRRRRSGSAW